MNQSLHEIGKLCLERNTRVETKVFHILRRLGIGRRPPTRRGTRAGRLHRIWHGLAPQPASPALIASTLDHDNYAPPTFTECPSPVPSTTPTMTQSSEVHKQIPPSNLNLMLHVTTNGGMGTGRHQTESSPSAIDKLHKPSPSHHSSKTSNKALSVCLLNSQSVNPVGKADLISDYIVQHNLDIMFITETWLRLGDDPKCKELTPVGYLFASFPRPAGIGGGIAIIYKLHLHPVTSFSDTLPYPHTTFEAV